MVKRLTEAQIKSIVKKTLNRILENSDKPKTIRLNNNQISILVEELLNYIEPTNSDGSDGSVEIIFGDNTLTFNFVYYFDYSGHREKETGAFIMDDADFEITFNDVYIFNNKTEEEETCRLDKGTEQIINKILYKEISRN